MATLNQMGRNLTRNTFRLRKNSELNLAEMARATGVSRRTLGRIEQARSERRTYNPMLKTVVSLAQAAGITVDEYIKTSL